MCALSIRYVQNKDGVKGQYFFLESDLKDGTALKLDKTGKSLLTVLRHLGRLTEVGNILKAIVSLNSRKPSCHCNISP